MKNLNLTFTQITSIYVGRDSGCRCGCHGKYYYSSIHAQPHSTVNDKQVRRNLFRAETLLETGEGKITDRTDNYINISHGNDRAICIYLT